MKKVYWYYIFCLVVLSACSNQTSDVIEVSKIQKMDVNDCEPSEGEDEEFVLMETYNESVRSNTDIIADFCILNQDDETTVITDDIFLNLFLPPAQSFVSSLNISYQDINNVISLQSQEDYEYAVVGLLILATELDCINTAQANVTRGGSFLDCFSEATGIAGGVSLVGAMAAGTMTKKQLLKVLGMIGGKTALRVSCGVGLALIAAEIAWCMY